MYHKQQLTACHSHESSIRQYHVTETFLILGVFF